MGLKVCQLCAVDFSLKHFLLPLIDGMLSKGWDVTAVCSDGPFVADIRAQGYRIQTTAIARSMNPFRALRSLVSLILLFRRERFDVLHVHTPVAALIGRIAARLVGIPLVIYTAHGFYFHEDMPRWRRELFIALEKFNGKTTNLLFSQSAEDAEDAIREGITYPERIMVIGNGVNPLQFDPERVGTGQTERVWLGIPENAFVVGCIGRQVREKGIVEFLQAAQILAHRHQNIWFLLIGERLSSDHAVGVDKEIRAACTALGERLVVLGLREDIPECLATMDIFCLPSWREGMPRTIIEAMMMGKPVVATNIRGAREEVVNEKTGLLVPVQAPEILANAIERFFVDPEWGKSLGVAGRKRALHLYDENKVVALQIERIEQEVRSQGLIKQNINRLGLS